MYALIQSGAITATGQAPRGARRLDTGQWVTPPADGWTPELLAACGWLPVVETPRPADTKTTTSDPAPHIKDVARAAKRIADAAIDLARYVAP